MKDIPYDLIISIKLINQFAVFFLLRNWYVSPINLSRRVTNHRVKPISYARQLILFLGTSTLALHDQHVRAFSRYIYC